MRIWHASFRWFLQCLIHGSNTSTDEPGSSSAACYPGSDFSSFDLSSTCSVSSSDESSPAKGKDVEPCVTVRCASKTG